MKNMSLADTLTILPKPWMGVSGINMLQCIILENDGGLNTVLQQGSHVVVDIHVVLHCHRTLVDATDRVMRHSRDYECHDEMQE